MPPPGGLRTSLSFTTSARGYGPMQAAFQPSASVFSPGLPLVPTAPQPVRVLDFGVGANTVLTPRSGYGDIHSFASLRAFANVELVRLAIETCKDQIERLDWKIKPKDGRNPKGDAKARIKEVQAFFRRPDGVTPFATWLRQSLEDLLVLDAPAFEKRRDRGGKLIGLDIVPGDTIKLLVDETGRRPRAPIPAFEQVIKGTPWALLTTDDLIYAPRNPRPNHLYGFGPVEQIIVTINTAMRRQAVQLGYFTEGNTPAGILNVPAGWGADTIKTMQDSWDARTEGNLAGKSKQFWVPEGTKYQPFKESPLKDEFDEWLARVVCFALSLPPTAFIKQMNRATAQSSADTADEEGIASRKLWWSRIADDVIADEFGYDDLEWGWNDAAEVQPLIQAQIDDLNLRNGSTYLNEVRDGRGLDIIDGGDEPMIYLPTGPVLVSKVVEEALEPPAPPPAVVHVLPGHPPASGEPPQPGGEPDQAPTPPAPANQTGSPPAEVQNSERAPGKVQPTAAKLAKAASPVAVDRPLVRRAQARVRKSVAAVLRKVGDDVGAQVEQHLKRLGKADDSNVGPDLAALISGQVGLGGFDDLDITDDLFTVSADSATAGLAQVGATSTDQLTNQVNAKAVSYAQRRGAELVSLQGRDNIVAPTREMIRQTIAKGLADNLGADAIAEQVQESTAFSADRADLIAQTEIATANSQGAMDGYREAAGLGITLRKAWQTSNDAGCCDDCQGNEDQGEIDLEDDFQSGDDTAPAHPNCRCVVVPIVMEDADGEDSGEDGADKIAKGNEDQPRDGQGRWTSGGGDLTEAETKAISSYTGAGYQGVNSWLRSGKDLPEKTQQSINALDSAIDKAPLAENTTLYRGLASAAAADVERQGVGKGSIITDKGFASTSRSDDVAKFGKAFAAQSRTGMVMRIDAKAGQKALDVSRHSDIPAEKESVLPRGSKFEVVKWSPATRVLHVRLV